MFYKKLLLFFSYAWRIMFVFQKNFHGIFFSSDEKEIFLVGRGGGGCQDSKHYEIFKESYKLHTKLL